MDPGQSAPTRRAFAASQTARRRNQARRAPARQRTSGRGPWPDNARGRTAAGLAAILRAAPQPTQTLPPGRDEKEDRQRATLPLGEAGQSEKEADRPDRQRSQVGRAAAGAPHPDEGNEGRRSDGSDLAVSRRERRLPVRVHEQFSHRNEHPSRQGQTQDPRPRQTAGSPPPRRLRPARRRCGRGERKRRCETTVAPEISGLPAMA